MKTIKDLDKEYFGKLTELFTEGYLKDCEALRGKGVEIQVENAMLNWLYIMYNNAEFVERHSHGIVGKDAVDVFAKFAKEKAKQNNDEFDRSGK